MASTDHPSHKIEDRSEWIKIHYETEKDYWWFALKRDLVIKSILSLIEAGSTILEVGSGGGKLSAELKKEGYEIISTDIEPVSARFTRDAGIEKVFISNCEEGIPLSDNTIDLILMTDVLEHIENDSYAISECVRVLKNKGFLLITVPAYPSLYSSWDKWNRHYRRYNKKMILKLVDDHNLAVVKITYWNILGVPFAVLRKFQDIFNPDRDYKGFPRVPNVIDSLLRRIVSIENKVIEKKSIPVGLSIVAVFQKKG